MGAKSTMSSAFSRLTLPSMQMQRWRLAARMRACTHRPDRDVRGTISPSGPGRRNAQPASRSSRYTPSSALRALE